MIIPIRCFTCNKVVGNKWDPFQKLLSEGVDIQTIFTQLRLDRYCCRRMLLTHVDIIDSMLSYSINKINID